MAQRRVAVTKRADARKHRHERDHQRDDLALDRAHRVQLGAADEQRQGQEQERQA